MDRAAQLRNVAFGGAWSEQIVGDELLEASMQRLDKAVTDTLYEDLRGFRVRTSVTGSSQSSGFGHTGCAAGARPCSLIK